VGKYRVLIKPSATKELEAIAQKKDRQRIVRKIESLADDPRPPGSHKLTGHDGFRIRQGRYRIVYEITDEELIVLVIKIADRKDVYRDL